jgi:polysaccharide pyruvyl transferase WcaK-like protein
VVVCEGSLFTSTFADSLAMLFTAFLGMAAALGKPAVAYGAEADAMSPGIEEFVRSYAAHALLVARNLPSQQRLAALGLPVELGTDTGWTYLPAHPEAAAPALRALGWDGGSEILVLAPTNPFRWPLVADPARALLASLSGEQPADHYQGIMYFQPAEVADRRCAVFLDGIAAAVRDYAVHRPAGVFPVIVGMEASDRTACEGLAERLGAPAPLVSDAVGADLIVSVLRSASLLVSARYHAVLLSMAAGVPAVGLAYDQRIPALLSEAGHAELALPVDHAELTAELARRLALLASDSGISADFVRFSAERREAQRVMGHRVAAYLRGALA